MDNTIALNAKTIADLIDDQYAAMLKAAEKLGEQNADWSPLGKGRTALSQLRECAFRAQLVTDSINGDPAKPWPTNEQLADLYPSFASAVEACRSNSHELTIVVRGLADVDLLKINNSTFGEMSLGRLLAVLYWNASYHEGQLYYMSSLAEQ